MLWLIAGLSAVAQATMPVVQHGTLRGLAV